MFAHVLAVLVGASSFLFYMAAFFYPEVHRPLDWVWSALGLLYAVVLWFCAEQMTTMMLLGQVIAIALLLALGWQTLSIRREKTPVYQQTPVTLTPELVSEWAKGKLNQLRIAPENTSRPLPPQNRSLNATAAERFRQVADPRRRPVYDYEFVEDGLVEAVLTSDRAEISTALAEPEAREELPSEDVLVTDYRTVGLPVKEKGKTNTTEDLRIIPPSVEAEVLSSVEPEKTSSKGNTANGDTANDDIADHSIQVTEVQTTDEQNPNSQAVAEAPSVKTVNQNESDDWGLDDDFIAEPSGRNVLDREPSKEFATDIDRNIDRKSANPAGASLAREKPSLLAAPVILLSWVKDVVSSLTRPKPSKPVIDIPRREPSATAPVEVPPEPPRSEVPDDDNSAQFDDDNSAQFDDYDNSAQFDDYDNSAQFDDDNSAQFDDDNSAQFDDYDNSAQFDDYDSAQSDDKKSINFDDDSSWSESNWDD